MTGHDVTAVMIALNLILLVCLLVVVPGYRRYKATTKNVYLYGFMEWLVGEAPPLASLLTVFCLVADGLALFAGLIGLISHIL